MPTAVLTSPEGEKYNVTHPEGATDEQIWQFFQGQLEQQKNIQAGSRPPVPPAPGQPLPPDTPERQRGIVARVTEGAAMGAGESRVPAADVKAYPIASRAVQALELPGRAAGAALGATAGLGAGIAEKLGMSKTWADRFERELGALGMSAATVLGAKGPGPTKFTGAPKTTLGPRPTVER